MRTIQTNENEFDLHENGRAGETHFACRLVLTQRQKVNQKWPIGGHSKYMYVG